MTTEHPPDNWVRMRFKGNKVWAQADAAGGLLIADGRVLIKYQLDQPHEYRVYPGSLQSLDDPGAAAAPAKRRTPRKATGEKPGDPAAPAPAGNTVSVYTDGASSGNPGPSGIGVVLRYGDHEKEISRYIGIATNNIAELEAVRAALSEIRNRSLPVRIHTDSSYVLGVLTKGWKAKKNIDLIDSIRKLMSRFPDLRMVKVQGHAGEAGNERADRLAVEAVRSSGG